LRISHHGLDLWAFADIGGMIKLTFNTQESTLSGTDLDFARRSARSALVGRDSRTMIRVA